MPVVPGTEDPLGADVVRCRHRRRLAAAIGYPLLVKAVAGGGGKGMRTVTDAADLAGAVRAARSEAGSRIRRRRGLSRATAHRVRATSKCSCSAIITARVLPFVERECSIQRRHQKVVEESAVARRVAGAARGG